MILIFDCCLSPFPGAVHDTWTSRGPAAAPPSDHDFYFLLACDPGLEAAERPNGGALMEELMPGVRQQLPIDQIFNEVAEVPSRTPSQVAATLDHVPPVRGWPLS